MIKNIPELKIYEFLFITLVLAPFMTAETLMTLPPLDRSVLLGISWYVFLLVVQLITYFIITRFVWISTVEERPLYIFSTGRTSFKQRLQTAVFKICAPVILLTTVTLLVFHFVFVNAPPEFLWTTKPTITFGILTAEIWFFAEILLFIVVGAYNWLRDDLRA